LGYARWASKFNRYLAPEYFVYGKVNDKTDMYAFGMVLLELITGRKPIDTINPKGQESLILWVALTGQEYEKPC